MNQAFAGDIKPADENAMINCLFRNLYNFSFREADSMVVVMKGSGMDNSTLSNIKANLAWWKLLSGDAIDRNLKTCDSLLRESINLGSKVKKQDINSLLNNIYSYSLKARLENYKGNKLKSLLYFYKSITFINECLDIPGKDEKLNLVLGLYYYFMDYIENEYFLINAMFFSYPKGDKKRGLIYLHECSLSDNEMIRTEAAYFLLKIYAYTEKDYLAAYQNSLALTQQHPDNLIYCLEQLSLLLKMKKDVEAKSYQRKLIDHIRSSTKISECQKDHFISQIGELTKTMIKE
jgi:sulfur transfer complex TusBCD TusB component (DsrH family)